MSYFYSKSNQKKLWEIADSSIERSFSHHIYQLPIEWQNESFLFENRGTFVTLTIGSHLRGCIGSILPKRMLWKDVSENAIHAAFHDPRFTPLTREEFSVLDLEVSVLTVPEQISPESRQDLYHMIKPGVDGVVLQHGSAKATFLPQVWEELPNPEDFFRHLCIKAGVSKNIFLTQFSEFTFLTYQVEIIKKSNP